MNFNYKRTFLRLFIGALLCAAIVGIFIFIAGDFGEIEGRILLTTLTFGGYSLTGLCSAMLLNKRNLKWFANLGISVSFLGMLLMVASVWELIPFEEFWNVIICFIVLSISIAHISLLFLVPIKTKRLKNLRTAVFVVIAIVAVMLMKSIMSNFEEPEFYYRILGVLAILDVAGSIALPILNAIDKKPETHLN